MWWTSWKAQLPMNHPHLHNHPIWRRSTVKASSQGTACGTLIRTARVASVAGCYASLTQRTSTSAAPSSPRRRTFCASRASVRAAERRRRVGAPSGYAVIERCEDERSPTAARDHRTRGLAGLLDSLEQEARAVARRAVSVDHHRPGGLGVPGRGWRGGRSLQVVSQRVSAPSCVPRDCIRVSWR